MLYEELVQRDIIEPIRYQLDNRVWNIKPDENGNPIISVPRSNACESPWILTGVMKDRQCPRWLDIYWTFYRFVPKGCHDCYKVVFRPQNLAMLMKVHEIQLAMGWPSKCGMERRDYTRGEYNAFWYGIRAEGVEGGRQLFRKVRRALTAEFGEKLIKLLIRNRALILKRACTEMENGNGPSDQWDYEKSPGALIEPKLDKIIVIEPMNLEQPNFIREHIMAKWVRWAYKIGDPTWSMFSDGSLFPKPPVTYHEDGPELAIVSEVK